LREMGAEVDFRRPRRTMAAARTIESMFVIMKDRSVCGRISCCCSGRVCIDRGGFLRLRPLLQHPSASSLARLSS
jgi:hypothetical protein